MSEIRVDTITDELGTGSPSLPNGLTVGGVNYPSTGPLSNRNLIINGAMQVAQRGTSFSNPTANQYMIDRWFMGGNPTNLTVTQQSNVSVNGTISNTMRLEASGVSNFDVYQAIENWQYLSGKTVTMSYWYRTNIDGVVLRQYNTATRDTLPTTNGAWQYRTSTFSMGTLQSNPRGAGAATLGFWNNTASVVNGSYFEFTHVQLEVGDTATPFEHRSYGQELALCQRYFQIWGAKGTNYHAMAMWIYSANSSSQTIDLPSEMRSSPTIARVGGLAAGVTGSVGDTLWALYYNGNWRGCSALTTGVISPTSFRIDGTSIGAMTGGGACGLYGGANAYFTLSAEL